MDEIPQPAPEPYSVGDRVRIYLGPDDVDSRFHGTVCEVSEVVTDGLGAETGRELDTYSYLLQSADSEEELPIEFRHRDLVPTEDGQ